MRLNAVSISNDFTIHVYCFSVLVMESTPQVSKVYLIMASSFHGNDSLKYRFKQITCVCVCVCARVRACGVCVCVPVVRACGVCVCACVCELPVLSTQH